MNINLLNKTNITICGMMGSGKSTIGQILAKKINFKFYDSDKIIEKRAGKSISQIFNDHGEKYFRELETKTLLNILQKKKHVISLGGGSVINCDVRNFLKKNSMNIYLKVSIETLLKRVRNSKNRPLLQNENLNNSLFKLLSDREKFYEEADLTIKNDGSVFKVVDNIIKKIS